MYKLIPYLFPLMIIPCLIFNIQSHVPIELGYHGDSYIGGRAKFEVVDKSGVGIEKVDWSVDGGILAQLQCRSFATTIPIKEDFFHQPFISFYWDNRVGPHTVSASVYLKNSKLYKQTKKITIGAPEVLTFRNDYEPERFEYNIGLVQDEPGNLFRWVIKTPVQAEFSMIQLIKANDFVVGGTHDTIYCNTHNQYVLDNVPDSMSVFFSGYTSDPIEPSEGVVPLPKIIVLNDQPAIYYSIYALAMSDYKIRMSKDNTFKTYLVYKPKDGIWVSLSRIDWCVKGKAEFQVLDWVVTSCSPAKKGTIYGVKDYSLLTWNNYYTNLKTNKNVVIATKQAR